MLDFKVGPPAPFAACPRPAAGWLLKRRISPLSIDKKRLRRQPHPLSVSTKAKRGKVTMMKAIATTLAEGTARSLGGLVLFTVGLFVILHSVILLLLAAVPVLLGSLVVQTILGKRPLYVESLDTELETEWKLGVAPSKKAAAGTVTARVVRAEGDCPLGYLFQTGETWVINGKVEGAARLCSQVRERLGRSADEIARREVETTSLVNCRVNGYILEVELRRTEELASPAAPRELQGPEEEISVRILGGDEQAARPLTNSASEKPS